MDLRRAERGRRRVAGRLHARGVAPRRRDPDAGRQPRGMGADDARVLPPGLRRPALHGAAAAEGPRAAPAGRAAAPGRRRRAQRRRRCAPPAGPARRSGCRSRRDARRTPPPPAELAAEDPCLITFTSGTSGEPKAVLHGQRYLTGQRLQAEHWLAPRARRPRLVHGRRGLVEVGPQRVHRALAARRGGAPARRALRPARAPGADRARARRRALHGADRVPRDRQARDAHAAAVTARRRRRRRGAQPRGPERLARGDRPLDPRRLRPDRDRPAHRRAAEREPRGRARWASRSRACTLDVVDGELVLHPETDPTFFVRYLGAEPHDGPWHTGDRVTRDEDGYLHFEGRTDDVIISAGYRIGPFEVESALVAHEAVAEAAVVAAPGRRARQRSSAPSSCCATATRRRTRWRGSSRTTSRSRPRRTSTRASWTSRRTFPRHRPGRSAAQRA